MTMVRYIAVSVGFGLVVGWFVAQPALAPQHIEALMAQLGHESATQREQASTELAQTGLPAMEALRQAAAEACMLWKVELPGGRLLKWNTPVVLTDDLAIFHGSDRKIHALSRADGTMKWEVETGCAISHMVLLGDKLISLGSFLSKVGPMALDPGTGKVLWRSENIYYNLHVMDTALVGIEYDGTGGEQLLVGLSPEDGTAMWTAKVAEFVGGSPIARCYISLSSAGVGLINIWHGKEEKSLSGVLVAVHLATGKKMWELRGVNTVHFIRDGRVYMHWKEEDRIAIARTLRVFDLKTGQEQKTRLEFDSEGYPQMMGDYLLENRAYSAALTAYDVTSGKRVWRYTPRDGGEVLAARPGLRYASIGIRLPVAMHDGAVLLIVNDGLLAVDLTTGKPRWKYSMECTNIFGLRVRDGVAYFMDDGYPIVDRRIIHGTKGDLLPGNPRSRYLYALDLAKASQFGVPPEYEAAEPSEK
ncbi:MAG: PQQ-binding-like beta-propeller repeat protein [Phycisphaerae bacterium]|nr:PQQ-binding-like beta-propeller repeat protein [Phycisphaerae bacterium]